MLLSKKTVIRLTDVQANYLAHMNYAASKLWNVLNYERNHYDELGLGKYQDPGQSMEILLCPAEKRWCGEPTPSPV